MNDKIKHRCDQLFKLNMMFNGDSYLGTADNNKDFNIHHTEISFDSDEKWNAKIEKLTKEFRNRQTNENT